MSFEFPNKFAAETAVSTKSQPLLVLHQIKSNTTKPLPCLDEQNLMIINSC